MLNFNLGKIYGRILFLFLTTGWSGVSAEIGITSNTESEPIRTYLIAGQSNADGYALGAGVLDYGSLAPAYDLFDIGREELVSEYEMVTIFRGAYDNGSGSWQYLAPGFGITGNGNRFGPELSFGHVVQGFFDEQIALIKYARGGTSLAYEWNPESSEINQYDYFIHTVANAIAEEEAFGVELKITGLLWMQGEEDATNFEMAENYRQNLAHFISRVRLDLGLPDLEIYIGTIANSSIWTYREIIWDAQQEVAVADPSVFLVDGKDLPLLFDDGTGAGYIHYSTQGQVALGELFAFAAAGPGIAPTASFKHSCSNRNCIFIDESTDADGTITSWGWDLGDGNVSNEQNPVHSYASAGMYTVNLTVTDNEGDTDSSSQLVYVNEPEDFMLEVANGS